MTTMTMTKLACPECQRQNEPERIYCHDCGARLDRSALAKVAPKEEDPAIIQRRLKQMLDPGRVRSRLIFFRMSKLILGASVAAALILMFLPPEGLPEKVKNIELQQLNLEVERAIETHSPTPLQFSDTQVNDFLYNVAKTKQAVLSNYLKFERAVVSFDEGVCQVTVERSFMGFSVFHTTSQQVFLQNGILSSLNKGGRIGRLPIHPAIMKYGDFLFSDLWTVLEPHRKLVSKMAGIEFHPKAVILTATPKQTVLAPSA